MEKLNQILDSFIAKSGTATADQVLGAAFVVVDKDGVVYQGAAGKNHTFSADSPQFSPGSFSWIASMTKIVTATCIMQVVEKGLVGLDDDVRPLVPHLAEMMILRGFVGEDKPFLEENTTPITLRQLLTHTVGLGYDIADPDLLRWSHSIGRTITNLEYSLEGWNTPLKFTPGQGWYYGSAMDWAGQVVEKVTGQKLGDYMAESLFKPLGMSDTTFHRDSLPHVKERHVPCAYRIPGTGELHSGVYPIPTDPPVDSGGAGLYTTAADHAKVLQALLRASAGEEGALLKRETVDEMFRPQLTDIQKTWLKFLTGMFHEGMAPDFEPGMPLDHGISGVINLEDEPGKRRKGSMMWAGMCNGHWFVDRETGIGASLIVNILPQPDAAVLRLWDALERAVYSDLVPSLNK